MRAPLLLLPTVVLACLTACAPSPKTEKKTIEPALQPAAVAGQKFQHDGVELYYEVHGSGEPLLLIHGNGGSSRDQGRSADSAAKITYEKMADDQAALLEHLKLGAVNVAGWSDGGIEALLLAIRHPGKVRKLVSMAANLTPQGLRPDALQFIREMLKDPKLSARDRKVTEMMLTEPQIKLSELEKITLPAQLHIFANATHMIPFDDPARFNSIVESFLQKPFVKIDRLGDTMKSLEKLRMAPAK